MSGVEQFETLLKETVQAKRLSASKMKKLEEIALQNFENDTQLVSILYRTHKSLPNSNKVSSLYVFDALSGAAKREVVKRKLPLETSSKGNAATFLAKMGGVVEGLWRDMQNPDIPEGKEKSKKVLDIWIKGSVFPSDLLARLGDILKGTEKALEVVVSRGASEAQHVPTHTEPVIMPPPMSPTHSHSPVPPAPAAPPAPPLVDPQATLLALLAQAANAAAPPAHVVPSFPPPPVNNQDAQLAAAQFVLQQLAAQSAGVVPVAPNPNPNVASSSPPIVSAAPGAGNEYAAAGVGLNRRDSRSPTVPNDPRRPPPPHREASRQEQRYHGHQPPQHHHHHQPQFSPENGRTAPYDTQSHSEFHHHPRAPYSRGGGYGGRGEGGGGRRRWDDRDPRDSVSYRERSDYHSSRDSRDRDRDRDRERDRERSPPPPPRRRRSRSRSPPRSSYGESGRRDYGERGSYRSPPRRAGPSSSVGGRDPRRAGGGEPYGGGGGGGGGGPGRLQPGKDEFGRDIRAASPTEGGVAEKGMVDSESGNARIDSDSTTIVPPRQEQQQHSGGGAEREGRASSVGLSSAHSGAAMMEVVAPSGGTLSHNSFGSPSNSTPSSSSLGNSGTNGAPTTVAGGPSVQNGGTTGGGGGGGGLDDFNFATFDFASAASWEALGKMWEATYGAPPDPAQAMQFVMSMGAIRPEVGAVQHQHPQPQPQQQQQQRPQQVQQPPVRLQQVQTWTSGDEEKLEARAAMGYGGRGRGGGARGGWRGGYRGGRGGYGSGGYGNGRGGQWGGGYHDDQGTDAIVLGGGGDSPPQQNESQYSSYQADYGQYAGEMDGGAGEDGGGYGGKMQRVGDKWVYIKS